MISAGFDPTKLKEFHKALQESEKKAGWGLWHGVGASLGAFRRDFLRSTKVDVGKASPKGQYRGANKAPKSKSRKGIVFRWDRFPKKRSEITYGLTGRLLGRSLRDISGSFFTTSTAAFSLEHGSSIRPKEGRFLVIPMLKDGRPNTAKRRKDRAGLQVKKTWATLGGFISRHGKNYDWRVEYKGSNRIVYAFRKYKQRKRLLATDWFPIFLMIPKVKMPDDLRLYRFFDGYIPQIEKRFRRELTKVLKKRGK